MKQQIEPAERDRSRSISASGVGVAGLEVIQVAVDLVEALLVGLGESALEPVLDLAEGFGPEDQTAGDGGRRADDPGEDESECSDREEHHPDFLRKVLDAR